MLPDGYRSVSEAPRDAYAVGEKWVFCREVLESMIPERFDKLKSKVFSLQTEVECAGIATVILFIFKSLAEDYFESHERVEADRFYDDVVEYLRNAEEDLDIGKVEAWMLKKQVWMKRFKKLSAAMGYMRL